MAIVDHGFQRIAGRTIYYGNYRNRGSQIVDLALRRLCHFLHEAWKSWIVDLAHCRGAPCTVPRMEIVDRGFGALRGAQFHASSMEIVSQ